MWRAGDAHFKFTVFEVRCSWGCAWWACGVRSGESVPRECAARRARGYRETQMRRRRVVCSIPPCQSRAATTKDIIFPLRLNKDAIVIVSVRASRVTRLVRAGPICNHKRSKTTRNSQNAGAGVVGLAHACPALSFCHRITQRALQPQQGVLWLCIVPAASSRTAASFSSRSARRDETWSSVELIVS